MKTEIKIKPFNGKFDLFIKINGAVVHCESFQTVADIEAASSALLERAVTFYRQADACEAEMNTALRSMT